MLTRGSVRLVAEHLGHRPARPCDDRRHQFSDDDPRVGPERDQRGTKREAHAQSADQDSRRLAAANSLAGHGRERLLGAAETAVHQLVLAEHDREFGAALLQAQFAAAAGH